MIRENLWLASDYDRVMIFLTYFSRFMKCPGLLMMEYVSKAWCKNLKKAKKKAQNSYPNRREVCKQLSAFGKQAALYQNPDED